MPMFNAEGFLSSGWTFPGFPSNGGGNSNRAAAPDVKISCRTGSDWSGKHREMIDVSKCSLTDWPNYENLHLIVYSYPWL